jgi:lysophospholipase L1-like esterase
MKKAIATVCFLALTLAMPVTSCAEHLGRIQILLLGDSTTEAIIPRQRAPKEAQLEEVIRLLLAAEKDLPPVNVINLGLSGEFIRRLLDSGRYDRSVAKLPGLDYILIRYGLNDVARIKDFDVAFPKDFHELLARMRKDHPAAMLIPMTVIPMCADLKIDAPRARRINDLVRHVAAEENLTCFDIYPRYAAEQAKGPNMLNYRRFPSAKIPERLRELAKPYVIERNGQPAMVEVLDNRLDAHFSSLEGWFGDRHPNLAGYRVIADETARLLAPIIRQRSRQYSKTTAFLASHTNRTLCREIIPSAIAFIVCAKFSECF